MTDVDTRVFYRASRNFIFEVVDEGAMRGVLSQMYAQAELDACDIDSMEQCIETVMMLHTRGYEIRGVRYVAGANSVAREKDPRTGTDDVAREFARMVGE